MATNCVWSFPTLGIKIVRGKIHLTCRDQLVVLHDLNGDEEIDFYECLNQDHQVTEHFHEFAMGLQVDASGNFYYAKSGRHALEAVVPHHGTLLKVSPDGSKTEILATGFRAANGVCLNPDGSFVVTDQEGFWNPKNRINWVTLSGDGKPKFYGNMFGYHDVTDKSDAAMEPPLCWITNAFDRSPAELLWVDSDRWGKLNGSLLNLSYGYGKVFLVPHEKVGRYVQGGWWNYPFHRFRQASCAGAFIRKITSCTFVACLHGLETPRILAASIDFERQEADGAAGPAPCDSIWNAARVYRALGCGWDRPESVSHQDVEPEANGAVRLQALR